VFQNDRRPGCCWVSGGLHHDCIAKVVLEARVHPKWVLAVLLLLLLATVTMGRWVVTEAAFLLVSGSGGCRSRCDDRD
jgi:hypothetical protein